VQLVWRRESGGAIEGRLAVVPDECAAGDPWWRRRRCSEAVLHEYLGMTDAEIAALRQEGVIGTNKRSRESRSL
jgi:hypothetical protein